MSVNYNKKLLLNQALQGGYRISRVRRDRRMLSLCAKVAFISVAALASAGIAAAAPAGGIAAGAGSVRSFAEGTTLTFTAADAVATNPGDSLIQLAHHGRGSHPSQTNSGGGFGNTGLGNQGRGNSPIVGNALGPRAGGGGNGPGPGSGPGPGPGPGPGGGPFGSNGGGPGGSFGDPWLLVRGGPSAEDGGTPGPGALGIVPACSLGENGITIRSDGQVLFAQFFAEQTALGFGKDGCEEVVNYPDTEDMAGK